MGIISALERRGQELLGREIPESFAQLSAGREQDYRGVDGDISAIRVARGRALWWADAAKAGAGEVFHSANVYLGDLSVRGAIDSISDRAEMIFDKGRDLLEAIIPNDPRDREFDKPEIRGEE